MSLLGSSQQLPVSGADITIHYAVPLDQDYDLLLRQLIEETPWQTQQVKIWGKSVPQPRLIAWYGEPGVTYSYSGIVLTPLVWTKTIYELKKHVELVADHSFNSVLLNYYRDHRDSMGLHSDDEPELGPRPTIASLSLGEERRFQLKHRHRKSEPPVSIPLPSGSLLVIRGDTQRHWKHGIPKQRRPCGPRVNLTFRTIRPVRRPSAHSSRRRAPKADDLRPEQLAYSASAERRGIITAPSVGRKAAADAASTRGPALTTLQFKGRVFVENHHLAVPYHEWRPTRSNGLSQRPSLHGNLMVEGDNLAALKALLPTHHGSVKCVYIDPPYNTGNEGWAYNDNVNSPLMQDWLGKVVDRDDLTRHDKWCCMMLPRLKLLRELLRDDGAIFVSIDDNEAHRLRCLMDDVFGEANFLATIVWQKVFAPKNTAKYFSEDHDFVLAYARNAQAWKPNLLERSKDAAGRYKNPDNDPRGPWSSSDLTARNYYSVGTYEVTSPSGRTFRPSVGNYFRVSKEKFLELDAEGRIWWGKASGSMPRLKRYISDVKSGVVPQTLWPHTDVGHTQEAKKELVSILDFERSEDVFNTVKPTRLIDRILRIATDKDSIVLDSFAGSGTTAHAVLALNKADGGTRRFVLVECEDYANSITAERVRRVIRGVPTPKDSDLNSGLGGTFSYFKLGQPMRQESILDGTNLPDYEALASYVYFTATGEEFEPKRVDRQAWFIGASRQYDVYLIYEPDLGKLKDMALTLDVARALPADNRNKLVFAPTKYLDAEFLHRYRITFQQLPFQIYEAFDKLATAERDA